MSTAKRPSRSQPGSRSKAKSVEAAMAMQDALPLATPAIHIQPAVQPLAWKDRPALIEHLFPAQQVSIEAQTERKAGAGQTLTALGVSNTVDAPTKGAVSPLGVLLQQVLNLVRSKPTP